MFCNDNEILTPVERTVKIKYRKSEDIMFRAEAKLLKGKQCVGDELA